ncbi:tail fiber protein, partial [Gallibacterium anatis]
MAGLREENKWENEIYRIEESDPVVGGEDGISNKPQKQLANRTQWLKAKINELFGKNTPKKITKDTTNLVVNDGHTHEIEQGSLTTSGIVQLTDSVNQDSSVFAATAKAVKTAFDKAVAAYNLAAGKANSTTNISAGNGLTGGGQINANRTIAMGTPSSITASTTNSVTSTSHTHAIEKGSLTTSGIVQLTDSVNQDSSVFAATAKAVKTAFDKAVA